jgi:hypothetical protein
MKLLLTLGGLACLSTSIIAIYDNWDKIIKLIETI